MGRRAAMAFHHAVRKPREKARGPGQEPARTQGLNTSGVRIQCAVQLAAGPLGPALRKTSSCCIGSLSYFSPLFRARKHTLLN